MAKRWSEAELRFVRDNAQKMSLQAIAEALSVRVDELEKKMEKLTLSARPEPGLAARRPLTVKELTRHTDAARKEYDRGVAALQKKKVEEAEKHFLDLIQKYPDEKEVVDRARVYLAVCERQKRAAAPAMTEPEEFYYAAVFEKNRGNVDEAIEHLKRAAKKNGGGNVDFLLACCYAQQGEPDPALAHLRRAIEEDGRNRILARNDRDFDGLRGTPGFLELLAI